MLSISGACVCGQRLQKYTNSCNITDRTIAHDGDYWMGYDNQSEELILHPHCPFDYCMSSDVGFTITSLHLQCAYNRTGPLCGSRNRSQFCIWLFPMSAVFQPLSCLTASFCSIWTAFSFLVSYRQNYSFSCDHKRIDLLCKHGYCKPGYLFCAYKPCKSYQHQNTQSILSTN